MATRPSGSQKVTITYRCNHQVTQTIRCDTAESFVKSAPRWLCPNCR